MPELESIIINIKDGLVKLVKDIQFWIDGLRVSFSRLYFLNDEDLLNLLAIGKDVGSGLINRHLPK